jgi:general stress protein CsbA
MVGEYIIMAAGCVVVGVVLTVVVLGVSLRLGISIEENLWVLAIPVVLSLILNISLLELYRKYRKRK